METVSLIQPEYDACSMERAVEELAERGYQLVSVSELLEARADGGSAGKIYYAA